MYFLDAQVLAHYVVRKARRPGSRPSRVLTSTGSVEGGAMRRSPAVLETHRALSAVHRNHFGSRRERRRVAAACRSFAGPFSLRRTLCGGQAAGSALVIMAMQIADSASLRDATIRAISLSSPGAMVAGEGLAVCAGREAFMPRLCPHPCHLAVLDGQPFV